MKSILQSGSEPQKKREHAQKTDEAVAIRNAPKGRWRNHMPTGQAAAGLFYLQLEKTVYGEAQAQSSSFCRFASTICQACTREKFQVRQSTLDGALHFATICAAR